MRGTGNNSWQQSTRHFRDDGRDCQPGFAPRPQFRTLNPRHRNCGRASSTPNLQLHRCWSLGTQNCCNMDSKEPLLEKHTDQEAGAEIHNDVTHANRRQSARAVLDEYFRRILPASLLVIALWSLFKAAFVHHHHWCPGKGLESEPRLVPLEAHIMSKCPDAAACLKDLVVPAMVKVSDKVNFTLSYIGRYGPDIISESPLP
jgi:hypothetical protein